MERFWPSAATHCVMCHAAKPTHEGLHRGRPRAWRLRRSTTSRRFAVLIERQTVQTNAMPLGNETGMTDAERRTLGVWLGRTDSLRYDAVARRRQCHERARHSSRHSAASPSIRPGLRATPRARGRSPSREAMIQAFADAVRGASRESQLALMRAHPDLGTRAGLTGGFLARAGGRRSRQSIGEMNSSRFDRPQ